MLKLKLKKRIQFAQTQDILDNYLEPEDENLNTVINILHLVWNAQPNQGTESGIQNKDIQHTESHNEGNEGINNIKIRYKRYIVGKFRSIPKRRRIISDIVEAKFIGDCTYYNSYCSCARMSHFAKRRKSARNVIWTGGLSGEWLYNLSEYFSTEPRKIIYCEIAGRNWTLGHKIGGVPVQRGSQAGQESMVETCFKETNCFNFITCASHDDADRQSNRDSNEEDGRNSQCNKRSKRAKLLKFFQEHPTAPISAILSSTAFHTSLYRFYNPKTFWFQNCFQEYAHLYLDMSIIDLYNFTQNANPVYACPRGDVLKYYYSIEESVRIIEELLYFQCGSFENVQQLLLDVFNVFERKVAKVNTFILYGEASSGKSYFNDMIVNDAFHYGVVQNFNKFISFPLQDCTNKRLLTWNEIQLDPGQMKIIKLLLGGDILTARVKYEPDAIIHITPIFCTSNQYPFPMDKPFNDRIISYMWRGCMQLRKYNKKPYHLCLYSLLQKYII